MKMPDWSQSIRERLSGLKLDPVREAAIVEELAGHLDARFRELLSQGATADGAACLALDELESSDALARRLRRARLPAAPDRLIMGSERKGSLMESLWYDFRVALRLMAKRPAFSAAVTGMLALGIAGNVAIFSIFNGLFLRPLPFPQPERLVDLDETAPKWNLNRVSISNPDYDAWIRNNRTFEGMAFFNTGGANLTTGAGAAQRIKTALVTCGTLSVFGLKPVIGRDFLPEEDRPNGNRVILLGYDLWQRLYHGDAHAVGQMLKLSERPYTVIGVLPREAMVPPDVDAWLPLQADVTKGGSFYLSGVGRLKPGVTQERARADLVRAHRTRADNADGTTSPIVGPLRDRYLGDYRVVSRILLGAVAVVLLIACVNIAGLMLVRGEARSREIAIRLAVGAGRGRVIRQLLTESVAMALAGGVAGVALGKLFLVGLVSLMPDDLPKWVRFDLDARFVVFCAAITGAAAVLFSLAPALQAASLDTCNRLQDMTRSTLTRGKRATLSVLVVGEIALALVLLAASGLVLQAFRNVMHGDPGFRSDNVLTFSLRLAPAKYEKRENWLAFYNQLLDRLRAVPGVAVASAASIVPLDGHSGYFYSVEGGRTLGPNDPTPVVLSVTAMSGYLEAMGITLKSGRDFDARDAQLNAPKTVLVNETFARFFWNTTDVTGRRIHWPGTNSEWFQVIGVVKDIRHYGLDGEIRPEVLMSFAVNPTSALTLAIRTRTDPHSLAGPAREIIRQLDPDLPMFNIRTMSERLDRSLWMRRAYSWLFVAFASVAMLLAAAGVYSVLSFAVSQRTREIGIRMALGARPGQVLGGILKQGMALVAVGVALGLGVSQLTAGLLKSMLFGVGPRDPGTYLAVAAGVGLVGLIANFVPARRAAGIEPVNTLRSE
jgi:putative ABC transport system permease protein